MQDSREADQFTDQLELENAEFEFDYKTDDLMVKTDKGTFRVNLVVEEVK